MVQMRWMNLSVPATPPSFQLVASSKGLMNSSHSRSASALYFSMIVSGVTTLPLLFYIRWPSLAQTTPWLRNAGKVRRNRSPSSNMTLVHIRA